MAKPTEKQVREFEAAHKLQLANLAIANFTFLNVMLPYASKLKQLKDYKTNVVAQRKVKAVQDYGQFLAKMLGKWYGRQLNIERRAGVQKMPSNLMSLFFSKSNERQLADMVKKMFDTPPKQLGFIPLLIWAVIAIVAAFTAYEIVNETTTTAQEKADLLKQTESTLKELNIPPSQAAAIITSTQQQATETGGGIFSNVTGGGSTLIPLAIAALIAIFLMQGGGKGKKAHA